MQATVKLFASMVKNAFPTSEVQMNGPPEAERSDRFSNSKDIFTGDENQLVSKSSMVVLWLRRIDTFFLHFFQM